MCIRDRLGVFGLSGYKLMSGVSTTDVVELEIEPNIDTTLTFDDDEDETFLNNSDNQTALTYLIDSKMGIELTFDNVAEELEVQGNYARLILDNALGKDEILIELARGNINRDFMQFESYYVLLPDEDLLTLTKTANNFKVRLLTGFSNSDGEALDDTDISTTILNQTVNVAPFTPLATRPEIAELFNTGNDNTTETLGDELEEISDDISDIRDDVDDTTLTLRQVRSNTQIAL